MGYEATAAFPEPAASRLTSRIVRELGADGLQMLVAESFPQIDGGLAAIVSPNKNLRYQAFEVIQFFVRRKRLKDLELAITKKLGPFRYEVAISYAASDREFATALAQRIGADGIEVFLDRERSAELLGEELGPELTDIFSSAQYAVIVLSRDYLSRPWPRLELGVLMAEQQRRQQAFVLTVRLDDSETPLPGVAFLDARQLGQSAIVTTIIQKVRGR